MSSTAQPACIRFAEFLLDRADERLIGPGGPVRIGNKAFQVLWTLAQMRGRLLTKEELFETVWDGTTVSESSLTSVIKELRQALRDDSRDPRFIESVYGRGYRFIAPVSETEARVGGGAEARGDTQISVCVLPFANISGEIEQEYFSDGITEDITTDLSKVSALSVTARNTAFLHKGSAVDVRAIACKLGVSHVLEGSVRKAGNRVRITAQLIDGVAGNHVWAERYDRDLNDIFALQDEISQAIVTALKLKLLPEEKRAIEQRGTKNPEAYDLYLMARQYWITGNHGDRRREERVIRICQRAIEIDPGYARAWAMLAIAQSSLRYGFSGVEAADDGVAAAKRALALDPTIAEAHCPLARSLAEQDRFAEADAEIGLAIDLDANSWEVNKEAARIYHRQRRIDEAARYFERAVAAMESDFHAWGMLFACYQAQGRSELIIPTAEMVLKQVERALAEDAENGAALSLGAASMGVLGQPERAKQWIERAILVDPDNFNMRYNFACALAASLHDKEGALGLLEPVLAQAGKTMVKIVETDPDLDSLRDDPRFTSMLCGARSRITPNRNSTT